MVTPMYTAVTNLAILAVLSQTGPAPAVAPEELMRLRYSPNTLALDKDGKLLVVGSQVGTVTIWNLTTRESANLTLHGRETDMVCFSPDGKLLATAGDDGLVRLLDVGPAPALEVRYSLVHGSPVMSVVFSPDGKCLASSTVDGKVCVWTLGEKAEPRVLFRGDKIQRAAAWSPDGKFLVAGDDEGRIRAFDAASGEEKFQLRGQDGMVAGLAFSPSGDLLAAVGTGTGGAVILWDFAGRKKLASLRGHDAGVGTACVAFSPDGKLLASGGGDGAIALWDVKSRERRSVLKTQQNVVTQLVFTPDGAMILWVGYGRDDRKVFRWKVDASQDKSERP